MVITIFPVFVKFLIKNLSLSENWFLLFDLKNLMLLLMVIIANSLLYFGLPNCKQKISQTIPGSILVALLLLVILKIFSFYLIHFRQFNLVYGSFGGIIGLLMVFYLFSLVFIFGAEFNYHCHRVYKRLLKNHRFKLKQY